MGSASASANAEKGGASFGFDLVLASPPRLPSLLVDWRVAAEVCHAARYRSDIC